MALRLLLLFCQHNIFCCGSMKFCGFQHWPQLQLHFVTGTLWLLLCYTTAWQTKKVRMFSSNLVSASLVFHCSFGSFIAFLNVWYTSTTLDFSFRMVQVHFFNIVFAVLNTLVTSSRDFEFIDLWCALAGAVGYALLYLLVLDRFGIHLCQETGRCP